MVADWYVGGNGWQFSVFGFQFSVWVGAKDGPLKFLVFWARVFGNAGLASCLAVVGCVYGKH
jgi:hypothetical protein